MATPQTPPLTLSQLQTQLAAYIQAETDVLTKGQSFQVAGRAMTRANLRDIREQIKYYTEQVNALTRTDSGARVRQIIPF